MVDRRSPVSVEVRENVVGFLDLRAAAIDRIPLTTELLCLSRQLLL